MPAFILRCGDDSLAVNKELMGVIACTDCKGGLSERGMFLVCDGCKLAYPVLDGCVPDMLMDDAWTLSDAKKKDYKHDLSL